MVADESRRLANSTPSKGLARSLDTDLQRLHLKGMSNMFITLLPLVREPLLTGLQP